MIRAWRLAIVMTIGLPLLWLSFAVSVAGVMDRTRSADALKVWPWSAVALATRSAEIMADRPGPADLAEVQRLAKASLVRQPVNAVAAQSLAFAEITANRSPDSAQRLLAFSEAMSRHVPQTQLWFIETAVGQANVAGALVHYDRILRISPELRPQLVPIVVAAADDPAIARPLATLLARRPPWRYDLIARLVTTSNNPSTLAYLLPKTGLSMQSPVDRNYLRAALERMVELHAADRAFALYRRLGGIMPPIGQAVVNGDFARDPMLPPFDWAFADGEGATANRETDDAGGYHLRVSASAGAGGVAASQVVMLTPGASYAFNALVRNDGDGNGAAALTLLLTCADGHDLFAQTARDGLVGTVVGVPPGCTTARLAFEMRGPLDGASVNALVRRVSLTRR